MPPAPPARPRVRGAPAPARLGAYWSGPEELLMTRLASGPEGLTAEEAASRRERIARQRRAPGGWPRWELPPALGLLLRQFTSPIIAILLGAALLSFVLASPSDGWILLTIVAASGALGFAQEHGAARAVRQLLSVVALQASVLRRGLPQAIPLAEVVAGDVVLLAAGDGIPGDCRLLESRDLCVDEAALTGESFPVNKEAGCLPAELPLAQRSNVLHCGSHVVSGQGRALVVHTGPDTAFGAIAARLRLRSPETEFERGVRRFGNLLVEITLLLISLIFAFNVLLARPVVDSFLFALALGVGLTPQLLPAIISVNLAQGARAMARRRVIVKRLAAIENFGSVDVLCSDKTGTLTTGVVRLERALAADGQASAMVLQHGCLNALFETGFVNPIDAALRQSASGLGLEVGAWRKLDEKPFDFHRKRQSVLLQPPVAWGSEPLLITKGALAQVLAVCTLARRADGSRVPLAELEAGITALAQSHGRRGERLLGVARRTHPPPAIGPASEQAMTFLGVLVLADPLKPGIAATVAELAAMGVQLKIITGDSALVAERIAREAGLAQPEVLSGAQLLLLSDAALLRRAEACDVFAEVEPNQKERLIGALRRSGHVVGYLGDGINDAPALHAADVGISVNGAVDAAKEAADIVLLDPDLAVLKAGILEGRRTFANTLKYVFMATSANFGNMFSMAGASLLLPFLPLLPKQILLTNLLTDLPEMTIASDRVDPEWTRKPRRWDLVFIRRFMLTFGLVSSVFDYLTFAVLLWLLRCDAAHFRTGWFVESVLSAALVVLVVRSRRPLLRSLPSPSLCLATLAVVAATLAIPYTPLGALFGFVPLPASFLALLALILLAYGVSAELVKGWFYRNHQGD